MVSLLNTFILNGEWKRCRRKVPRVQIQEARPIVAISYPEISDRKFPVNTIAEFGACYRSGQVDVSKLKGNVVRTTVWIGVLQFELNSRLIDMRNGLTSVEFLDPPENFRSTVVEHFQLELKAASLVPYISFDSVEPGPTHTVIYSDGTDHELILSMYHDRLEKIQGRLATLSIRFTWTRQKPTEIEYEALDDDATLGGHLRHKVAGFVFNLPDLPASVIAAVQQATTA